MKRYDLNSCGDDYYMVACPDGDYVRFADVETLRVACALADMEIARLRAEVDRLRDTRSDLWDALKERAADAESSRDAAESRLADATELLRRAHDTLARLGLQWVDAPVPLIGDLRAFLAAHPGAPPLGHPGADEVFERLQAARQPAAPARTCADHSNQPARTEAEGCGRTCYCGAPCTAPERT